MEDHDTTLTPGNRETEGPRPPTRLKWVRKAALVLCGLAVGLVLCELGARLLYRGLVVTASLTRRDPDIGVRLIPGARGRATCSSYRVTYAVNEQGLRDDTYPEKRPPDTFRVLVLGDSFVFGHGVERHEIFTEVAERDLNAKGTKAEIINAGVFGYGTDNELLWFDAELQHAFRPDLVYVLVYPNDCGDNESHGFFSLEEQSGNAGLSGIKVRLEPSRLEQFGSAETPADTIPLYRSFLVKLHLVHVLANTFLRPAFTPMDYPARPEPDAFRPASVGANDLSHGVLLTVGILNELKARSRAPVRVGLVRQRDAYHRQDPVFEQLRWALRRLDPEGLDVYEFPGEETTAPLFIRGGWHWSAEGHRRAAKLFADRVVADRKKGTDNSIPPLREK